MCFVKYVLHPITKGINDIEIDVLYLTWSEDGRPGHDPRRRMGVSNAVRVC